MIKKYIIIIAITLISLSSIGVYTSYIKNKKLNEKISILTANQKAFISENSSLKNSNEVFKFTIEQLNYYNDSILDKMNKVRKELNIKDKELKQLQYITSEAIKRDTIIFTDTLFRDKELKLDTILGDNWYQLKLNLIYPSTIITEPSFISEKYIITSSKRETIDPPKKFFIARWFQKKHTVIRVEVIEKNPYIKEKQQKFIEIIK